MCHVSGTKHRTTCATFIFKHEPPSSISQSSPCLISTNTGHLQKHTKCHCNDARLDDQAFRGLSVPHKAAGEYGQHIQSGARSRFHGCNLYALVYKRHALANIEQADTQILQPQCVSQDPVKLKGSKWPRQLGDQGSMHGRATREETWPSRTQSLLLGSRTMGYQPRGW